MGETATWTYWLIRSLVPRSLDLGGLQVALEDLLGIRVDLLTPGDLPQRSREKVLREALPV